MTRTRVTLYGGVNEIGGNKFLLEEGEHRILLDFGTSIGARNGYYDEFLTPRTNAVLRDLLRLGLLPDIDGVYREDFLRAAKFVSDKDLPISAEEYHRRHGRYAVDAILVTHAHVDHVQDVSFVHHEIPVYCTRTTHAMLQAIDTCTTTSADKEIVHVRPREETVHGDTATFPRTPNVKPGKPVPRAFRPIDDHAVFDVGGWRVQAVPVDHSVPGAVAFMLRTPSGKRVFYTGDIRFRGRLMDRTKALRDALMNLEPDLILSEGTRIASDDAEDEEGVERDVKGMVEDASGLVFTEFGWKDTTRFDTLQRVAAATDRVLLVNPRTAHLLRALDGHDDVPSRRLEAYGNVGVYVRRKGSLLGSPADWGRHEVGYETTWTAKEMREAQAAGDEAYLADRLALHRARVDEEELRKNPHRYMVHLTYWDVAALFDIDPPRGSRWVRCATEPFSDEMSMDLARQQRWMEHFHLAHNVNASRDGRDEGLLAGRTHISGHGSGADLKDLLKSANPRHVVPVHTDAKTLDHFEDLGCDTTTWPKATFRQAAKGQCVVEL